MEITAEFVPFFKFHEPVLDCICCGLFGFGLAFFSFLPLRILKSISSYYRRIIASKYIKWRGYKLGKGKHFDVKFVPRDWRIGNS